MNYANAREAASACATYEEVDALLKSIEECYDTISDRQYYSIKRIAINAVYAFQTR